MFLRSNGGILIRYKQEPSECQPRKNLFRHVYLFGGSINLTRSDASQHKHKNRSAITSISRCKFLQIGFNSALPFCETILTFLKCLCHPEMVNCISMWLCWFFFSAPEQVSANKRTVSDSKVSKEYQGLFIFSSFPIVSFFHTRGGEITVTQRGNYEVKAISQQDEVLIVKVRANMSWNACLKNFSLSSDSKWLRRKIISGFFQVPALI